VELVIGVGSVEGVVDFVELAEKVDFTGTAEGVGLLLGINFLVGFEVGSPAFVLGLRVGSKVNQ
jgi:hypothetical protein